MRPSEQLSMGQIAEARGDYVAAATAYRALLGASDSRTAAEASFLLGRVSWRQGRLDAALEAYETARASCDRIGDDELQARVQIGLGALHYARGEHDAARRAYAEAEGLTSEPGQRAKILLNLGVIESAEERHAQARDLHDRAFTLFERAGDGTGATLALFNRGMVEAELLLWTEASASFGDALERAIGANDRELTAKTLVNRSEALVELGDLLEALDHCDRALVLYAEIGDEAGRGETLRWRAHALGRAGDLTSAERNANEALQIAMRAGARLLEAQTARDLGVLRGLMGDRAGGVKELRRALAIFTGLGARREAQEIAAMIQRPTPARSLHRIADDDAT